MAYQIIHFRTMKWADLEEVGWRLEKQDPVSKRYVYKTPIRGGLRQTIRRKSDLKESDKKLAKILFPSKLGGANGKVMFSIGKRPKFPN